MRAGGFRGTADSAESSPVTYLAAKTLHLVFIVTWFSGLFYMVRLLVYNREAADRGDPERAILHAQYCVMLRRLWYGIAWPSALATLGIGLFLWTRLGETPGWLRVKLGFLAGLFAYHGAVHRIYRRQTAGDFRTGSLALRIWNEGATLFLFAIVPLAVFKEALDPVRGLAGLALLAAILAAAVLLYRRVRAP